MTDSNRSETTDVDRRIIEAKEMISKPDAVHRLITIYISFQPFALRENALDTLLDILSEHKYAVNVAAVSIPSSAKLLAKMNADLEGCKTEGLSKKIQLVEIIYRFIEILIYQLCKGDLLNGIDPNLKQQLDILEKHLKEIKREASGQSTSNRIVTPRQDDTPLHSAIKDGNIPWSKFQPAGKSSWLKFRVECLLEAIKLLQLKVKPLTELQDFFESLFLRNEWEAHIFKGIDFSPVDIWYIGKIVIKHFANLTHRDGTAIGLYVADSIIQNHYKKLNWRFSYAAICELYKMCNSPEEKVRHHAYFGQSDFGQANSGTVKLPPSGFRQFIDLNLDKYEEMVALSKDRVIFMPIDPNALIRVVWKELLSQLTQHSDPKIRQDAIETMKTLERA